MIGFAVQKLYKTNGLNADLQMEKKGVLNERILIVYMLNKFSTQNDNASVSGWFMNEMYTWWYFIASSLLYISWGRLPLIVTATGHSFKTSLPIKRVMCACQFYIMPVFETSIYNNNSTMYTDINSNYVINISIHEREEFFK